MGKVVLVFILSQIASNGFWYCYTMQSSVGETPFIMVPFIASIVLMIYLMQWVYNNWSEGNI